MQKLVARSDRGVIAVSTLLISVILLILVLSLLVMLRSEKHSVLRHNVNTEMLYIAEAGVEDAVAELTRSNGWNPTTTTPHVVTLPNGGTYRIVFDDDGTIEPFESINNLSGNGTVNGPLGPGTVPRQTAHIVVTAESRGNQARYHVLLSRGRPDAGGVAILNSGKMDLRGGLEVSGIESLDVPDAVTAGLHTNDDENVPGIISWDGNGEDAFINGFVSTSSPNAGAVQSTGGTFNASGINTSSAPKRFPNINIPLAVNLGSFGNPPLIPTPGSTTPVNVDSTFAGGVINGDLRLNGANLYVSGDLEVNGSITGTGSVYVTGDTTFKGSSELSTDNGAALAILSQGNVSLTGFDGSQFLDSITDPTFVTWNNDAETAHTEIQNIAQATTYGTVWGPSGTNNHVLNDYRRVLGEPTGAVPMGMNNDVLEKMAVFLETTYPSDDTASFLVDRLRDTKALYEPKSGVAATVLADYAAGNGPADGVLHHLIDDNDAAAADKSDAQMGLQNFDRLGSSYFQGIVYTNGAFHAANEIEIVGALYVEEKPNVSDMSAWTVTDINGATKDLLPGDILVEENSTLVFNEDLASNPFRGSPRGPVSVSAWIGESATRP